MSKRKFGHNPNILGHLYLQQFNFRRNTHIVRKNAENSSTANRFLPPENTQSLDQKLLDLKIVYKAIKKYIEHLDNRFATIEKKRDWQRIESSFLQLKQTQQNGLEYIHSRAFNDVAPAAKLTAMEHLTSTVSQCIEEHIKSFVEFFSRQKQHHQLTPGQKRENLSVWLLALLQSYIEWILYISPFKEHLESIGLTQAWEACVQNIKAMTAETEKKVTPGLFKNSLSFFQQSVPVSCHQTVPKQVTLEETPVYGQSLTT